MIVSMGKEKSNDRTKSSRKKVNMNNFDDKRKIRDKNCLLGCDCATLIFLVGWG